MRLPPALSIPAVAILACGAFGAIDRASPDEGPAPAAPPAANPSTSKPDLEKRFAESLSNVVMEGRWCLVSEKGLGEEKADRYTIRSVTKVGEDTWVFLARIQYGQKDVTLPVAVKVYWAGDTPVVTVQNAGLPGLGTYSARVLFHEGTYAGTWSGGGHAGLMSGRIVKAPKEAGEAKDAGTETKD